MRISGLKKKQCANSFSTQFIFRVLRAFEPDQYASEFARYQKHHTSTYGQSKWDEIPPDFAPGGGRQLFFCLSLLHIFLAAVWRSPNFGSVPTNFTSRLSLFKHCSAMEFISCSIKQYQGPNLKTYDLTDSLSSHIDSLTNSRLLHSNSMAVSQGYTLINWPIPDVFFLPADSSLIFSHLYHDRILYDLFADSATSTPFDRVSTSVFSL